MSHKARTLARSGRALHAAGMARTMIILGCGYIGQRLARAWLARGGRLLAIVRREEHARALAARGIAALAAPSPDRTPAEALAAAGILVDSIPLEKAASGAPRASQPEWIAPLIRRMPRLRQALYLSTTGVYGDAGGAWVDEDAPCRPASPRGIERLRAERAWLDSGLPAEVFRLAGIYGPGRHILGKLRAGGYKAVRWQPPRWSNRVHADDIVAALLAAIEAPRPGRIVNVADDLPLPHADYARELAEAIGAPAPRLLTPEEAARELSPAALDFFRDSKRVSNARLKRELLPRLRWPDFRAALADRARAFGEATGRERTG